MNESTCCINAQICFPYPTQPGPVFQGSFGAPVPRLGLPVRDVVLHDGLAKELGACMRARLQLCLD